MPLSKMRRTTGVTLPCFDIVGQRHTKVIDDFKYLKKATSNIKMAIDKARQAREKCHLFMWREPISAGLNSLKLRMAGLIHWVFF